MVASTRRLPARPLPPVPISWSRGRRFSPAERHTTPTIFVVCAPAAQPRSLVLSRLDAHGHGLRRHLSAALWRTPLYRLSLWGRTPKTLAPGPSIPARNAPLKGGQPAAPDLTPIALPPWEAPTIDPERQAMLHGF